MIARLVVFSTLLAGAWLGSSTWAQTLRSPSFYLSSAPRVEIGGRVDGALTSASGQNFKDGSRVEVVALRLLEGQRVTIDVQARDFDAYLTVFAPDGDLVDAVDDGPTGLDPVSTFTASASGTHLLVVSGFGPYDLGRFTVTVREATIPPATVLEPGTVASAVLDASTPTDPQVGLGPSVAFLVDVAEPSLLWVEASSLAFDTVVTVFDGSTWLGENDDAGGTSDSLLTLEVPAGSYRVVVSSWDGSGGPFEVLVRRFLAIDPVERRP